MTDSLSLWRRMYRSMLSIRIFEERLADLIEAGEIRCPCHLYVGQEGIAAGVCAALETADTVWGGHRSHGHYLAKGGDIRSMMAEIYGKATGCSRGRGGSMHVYAPEVGVLGTVPLVAATIPIAAGAALANKLRGDKGVAVAFFGDGATEEGHFHESLNLAAIYKLPTIFVCENNLYSSHMALLERRVEDNIYMSGAAHGLPGIVLDGNDAIAVHAAATEAVSRARAGEGPTLLECRTYRWRGHVGPSYDMDVGVARKDELDEWKPRDPLKRLRKRLLEAGEREGALDEIRAELEAEVEAAVEHSREAPYPESDELHEHVYCEREGAGRESLMRTLNYAGAIREAHEQLLESDSRVFVIGQGLWSPWYVGSSMTDLDVKFGRDRILDCPVSENATTAAAVGAALAGMRPIIVHPRMDFMTLAIDPIINQAANWSYMFAGKQPCPVTIRPIINRGGEQAAQHSQALQAYFAHVPGLKVVMPATARDAKGLLIAAVRDDNPVLYIDDRWLYSLEEDVPEEIFEVEIGKGAIRREGEDVTIVGSSWPAHQAVLAAEILAERDVDAEVIDLRSIKPWDKELVLSSVAKTGRLVVVDGGWHTCGYAAEVAATVASEGFDSLRAPIERVCLPDLPAPMAKPLEEAYYQHIRADRIAEVAEKITQKERA